MYRSLDPSKLVETLVRLEARIRERFPGSGLGRVCVELIDTARTSAAEAARLARPSWPWRIGVGGLVVAGFWAQVAAARFLHLERLQFNADLLQILEAAVNLLILFGGAVWFLLTVEKRRKRGRALDALHSLRALAHVIDMHQLAKDPERAFAGFAETSSSPPFELTPFQLDRYLNYCGDLLALVGKVAAWYLQGFQDEVVLGAVNEIEDLTNGLSRKIWQKLMLLDQLKVGGARSGPEPRPPSLPR